MSTTTEMAKLFLEKLANTKLVGIGAATGLEPGFIIMFENDKEQRCTLAITASISAQTTPNEVLTKVGLNTALSDWAT